MAGAAGKKSEPDGEAAPTVIPGSAESGDGSVSAARSLALGLSPAPLAAIRSLGLVLASRRRRSANRKSH